MSRTLRAIVAVVLIGIITFSAIIVIQNLGFTLRADITEQNLYTLSDGTRTILKRIHQPITLKLYYTKTATMKARDEIRFYNQYFSFVKALLGEYRRLSKGKVNVEIIDPRPYSKEEEAAVRYGLTGLPITQEEKFFFGLVLQTQFGVVKTMPFFSPHRQNFVEYDISHLIDTAITREKERIGILSSLAVTGEEEGYMAQLRRMQGRAPQQAWTFVTHLRQQYEVKKVEADVEEINDVDILLVVHPKDLSEKTQFAIDQFVLKGGRAIIFVDPRCFVDDTGGPMGRQRSEPVSNLSTLFSTWGVTMPQGEFAGDRYLAIEARMDETSRAEKLIGYLNLNSEECFNRDNVVTSNLNEVRMLFGGILQKTDADTDNQVIPLVQTTSRGNSWSVEGLWDWVRIVPEKFMGYFEEGTEPVVMGCLIKGRFKSSFPQGIEVQVESDEDTSSSEQEQTKTKKLTGLKEAAQECAVIVFSDVDFISDLVAYQNTIFGLKIPVANNSDLLLNAIEQFTGSSELIGLRSRGNYARPFEVVNKIRRDAEDKWAQREKQIRAEIERLENELSQLVSKYQQGQQELVGGSVLEKKNDLRVRLVQAQRELRNIKMDRNEKIEQLGNFLQNVNMLSAPAVIFIIAVLLRIRQALLSRKYVTHKSDAG